MGKMNSKRKANRDQYLIKLAHEDPEKFREQWQRRLISWGYLAQERARHLLGHGPGAFDVVKEAKAILESLDASIGAEHMQETLAALNHAAGKAIAIQIKARS